MLPHLNALLTSWDSRSKMQPVLGSNAFVKKGVNQSACLTEAAPRLKSSPPKEDQPLPNHQTELRN